MVKLLTSEEITDTVIVVTRYFGGIKLGSRRSSQSIYFLRLKGLSAAGVCGVYEQMATTYSLEYTFLAKLQSLEGGLFTILDIRYSDKVEVDLACEPEDAEQLEELIDNITAGRGRMKKQEKTLIKKLSK